MTVAQEAVRHYADAFRSAPATKEPWLAEIRNQSLARFESLGFPGRRDEGWKYTDLRALAKRNFRAPATEPEAWREAVEATALQGLDCHRLVFVNGQYSAALSAADALPPGVRLGSVRELLASGDARLRSQITAGRPGELDTFTALNAAFLADGAFLQLDDEALAERPVHLVWVSVPEAEPVVTHPHTIVLAGAASKATVIEQYVGIEGAANFTNAVTVFHLAASAQLEHYRLQEESAKGFHIGSVRVRQQQHSRFSSSNIDLGGHLVRNDLHADLAGPGAHVGLNGLYMVNGRHHVDNHLRIDHSCPDTTSEQRYKGILDGHARAVFNGKVVVHKDAQRTDAQQENHNLLLSDHAEVDTKPELEIYADDVKCSHGATVGNLDKNALFYLRSRGLDEGAAREVLTFAFAEDIVLRLALAPLRKSLERAVARFLPHRELIEEFV